MVRLSSYRWHAAILALSWWAIPTMAFTTINRIKASGELHVAVHSPHRTTYAEDTLLLQSFAEQLGAEAVIHYYNGFDALLAALREGEVDLIGEALAISRPLGNTLVYSLPVRHSDLWVVSSPFVDQQHLTAHSLAVQFASDGWHHALQLRTNGQRQSVRVIPSDWSREDILGRVASGQIDVSLAYAHEFTDPDARYANLRPRQRLAEQLALGWVLRKKDRVLHARLDDFLQKHRLTRGLKFIDQGDWGAIQARGRLRLITLYRPETYFVWKGRTFGFEYELADAFAGQHGLRLDVVLASDVDDLQRRLARGEADFGAAFLRADRLAPTLTHGLPHVEVQGRLVSQAGRFDRLSTADLYRRSVLVANDSPYLASLQRWQSAGIEMRVQLASAMDEVAMIDAVANGLVDFTVVDDYRYGLHAQYRQDIDSLRNVASATPRVWAVRRDNPQLLNALDAYWRTARNGLAYRVAEQKYFGDDSNSAYRKAVKAYTQTWAFSPYDALVRRYAGYYEFDWRLILAVVAQESRFDPNAVSATGARGLMQLQRAAARQVGIADLFEPQSNIHAGVRYLDWLRDQFEADLDIGDRTWFSLAAYNGGLQRVRQARRLATQLGLDRRQWFDHVERAMDVLSDPAHDPAGRYAGVDTDQIVAYVRSIRQAFESYVRLTPAIEAPVVQRLSALTKLDTAG